jgi:hypothetical protein
MASDSEREVYRQYQTAQEKYIYFLLAAAASGVALAVQQTRDSKIAWPEIALALAVLSWAVSFFAGCRNRLYAQSGIFANFGLLKVESGRHEGLDQHGQHPTAIAGASAVIRDAIAGIENHTRFWANVQFNCLVAGAVLYLTWHVLGMVLRTYWP